MRTRCDHGRMSSTIRSTVTITPRARRERAPHPFEQRRVHRDVALAVGDRRVQERDVGHAAARAARPRRTACRPGRTPSFASIDEPAIERVTIAGSPRAAASSRCENARNDQCSTSTSPRSYAPREPRVGGEVGERVARVAGDHLAHQAAAEEQRAEARQREHHERELRIAAPPLPHDLAGRRGPARVPDDRMEHVAGAHVLARPRRRAYAVCPACPKTSQPSRPVTSSGGCARAHAGSDPASVPATADSDRCRRRRRRYRGLSAEERRADQRRRLVRAAIDEFAARGYHRTSVEDIVRSAHTSRTAFYAFFDNREDAMYGALQTSPARAARHDAQQARARAARRRASSRSASARTSTASSPIPRPRRDHPARRRRHVARGQRAAQPHPARGRRR